MAENRLKQAIGKFRELNQKSPRNEKLSRRGNSLLFLIVTTTFSLLFTCGLAYTVTVKLTIQKESIDLAVSGITETLSKTYTSISEDLIDGENELAILQSLGYPFVNSEQESDIVPFFLETETKGIITRTEEEKELASHFTDRLEDGPGFQRDLAVGEDPARITIVENEGLWWVIGAVPISGTDKSFGAARDITNHMLRALHLQQQLVGLLVLSYAFFLALLILVMKIITNPIRALTEAAEKFTRGDFDHQVEVPKSMTEIQVLASAFNRMGTELKAQRNSLQANSRELEIANLVRGEAMDKLSRKNRELSAMIETSMLANQLTLPDQIVELTAKRLRDDLHLTYAVLYVPSEEGILKPRRMPGLPLPVGGRVSDAVQDVLKRCHDTRSPQRLQTSGDIMHGQSQSGTTDKGQWYFGERLYLPLDIDTTRVGVLELIAQPDAEIDKETEAFCRHFVNHMGVILRNKALYHETIQRTGELEKINQVSRAISGKLDMSNLLEDVVIHTQKSMNARCAFIGIFENGRLSIRHMTPGAVNAEQWKEEIATDAITSELISSGHSVLINDLDHDQRVLPSGFIHNNEFRSFIGCPIHNDDEVIGILAAFSHEPSAFTSSDIHFLGLLASQVSIALANAKMYEEIGAQARRRQDQLTVAQKLQRDRMPSFFKQDIAAFNSELKPAYELAGDFCDVFSLGRNTIAVVVGDVANKGVAASLMTFSLLSMFRNIAKTHRPPCEIMDAINSSLIAQIKEDGWFATAFYARFNTSNGILTYSSAGHEMPILYRANTGEVEMLETTGYPLGIFDIDQFRYETREIQLQQGDRIVFYTDGITDATDTKGNRFGHSALRKLITDLGNLAADKLTSAVIERVEAFTGGREQRDDIIVAVLEYQRDPWIHKRVTFRHASTLVNEILEALKLFRLDQGTLYGIRLAVDEAMANAWRHGLGRNDDIYFDVSYLVSDECFKFRVLDPGSGFDHESLPDPTVPENLFKSSGRGVFLIRQMMDDVDFNELGNEITITKTFPLAHDPDDSDSDRIGFDDLYDLTQQQESLIRARETLDSLTELSKHPVTSDDVKPVNNPS